MTFSKDSTRLFDDLAQLAGGAASLLSGLRHQMREEAGAQVNGLAARANLVTRDDLKRLEGMIAKARLVQDEILKRLDALEGRSKKTSSKTAKPSTTKKKKARRE